MAQEKLKQDLVRQLKEQEQLAEAHIEKNNPNQFLSGEHEEIEARTPLKLAQELKRDLELNYERTILSIINRIEISKKIKKFYIEKGWSLPDIKIITDFNNIERAMESELEIESWLWEEIWRERRKSINGIHDVAVIFKLPKPLSIYWFKGEEKESDPDKTEGTPYGTMYRQSMATVWESIGYFISEAPKGLRIHRLNDVGDHKPGKYYYIWYIYQSK